MVRSPAWMHHRDFTDMSIMLIRSLRPMPSQIEPAA